MAPRCRRRTAAFFAHLGVAVACLWPSVLHFTDHIPLGSEPTPTVPFFNLWTLEWNAYEFAHGLAHYWDAPIFAPSTGAFARSEAQPLTGAVFWVLRTVIDAPAAYSLLVLAFLVLNGLAAARLARTLGAGAVAAIATGVLAQVAPFVIGQLGVLQLVCAFPFWFALERIVTYRRRPALSVALGIAAWCIVCILTSGYYAIFLAVMLAVTAPAMLLGVVPLRRFALHAVIVIGVVAVVCGPYLLAQERRTSGERWTTSTVTALSATPSDYFQSAPTIMPAVWSRRDASTDRDGIAGFPGLATIALAASGAAIGWRRGERRSTLALVGVLVVGAGLSGGMHLGVGAFEPYRLLFDHVPGFDRLRSPYRFIVLTQVALVGLAAFAVDGLWNARRRLGRVVVVGAVLAAMAEGIPASARSARVPDTRRFDWVEWLDTKPTGNVALVPFPATGSADDYVATTVAMLAGFDHGHPLVNGYTGFFPADYYVLWSAMRTFPSACSTELLQQHSTKYLVVDRTWLSAVRRNDLGALGWHPVFDGHDHIVYAAGPERLHGSCE